MKKLSEGFNYAQDLPGIYAFTGNDHSPPFYRKDKIRHITLMNKNAFMTHGELLLANGIINIIEQFTCHLYGYTKQTEIHEAIKIHSENKTKPKSCQKPLNCIKGNEP